MTDDKVACRTPAEGRDGVSNIPRWKFELLRASILAELREGDVPFSELNTRLRDRVPADDLDRLGSLGWHATTVKLELEVRGDVARLPGPGPQVMTLGPAARLGA